MASDGSVPRPMVLRGRWGMLRPLEANRDAVRLFELTHDKYTAETWAEMKVGPFESLDAFRAHVDELVADSKRAFYAVVANDGDALGWLCLMEAQPPHKTVEVGYVLYSPVMQRSTLATEAFYLIMSHVFDDMGYDRLEWTCTAANVRSQKAAVRLGFQFEGTMRRKLIFKGRPHDIPIYSMVVDEWPAVKAAMQKWLLPENFIDGRQIEPLGAH